jgi:hypothetical protein
VTGPSVSLAQRPELTAVPRGEALGRPSADCRFCGLICVDDRLLLVGEPLGSRERRALFRGAKAPRLEAPAERIRPQLCPNAQKSRAEARRVSCKEKFSRLGSTGRPGLGSATRRAPRYLVPYWLITGGTRDRGKQSTLRRTTSICAQPPSFAVCS